MRVTASAALLALRMWWPILAIFALLGGALGVYAVRDAPYMAVTTLRVDTAGYGEVAQQSIVQTARLLVDSNRTYSKVAGDAPEAIQELRQRTAVDIVEASSVLEISVSAQTPERAERDLNALVDASITSMRELADEQFTGTIRSGRDALAGGALPDPAAEAARREGIGTAISARQDNALRLSAQLSRIGAILPAAKTGLGPKISAVIGALSGAFVGSILALVLGVGRRRIKRLADLRAVAPGLLPAQPMDYAKGVVAVGSDCSRIDYALAVVLALPGAEDDLADVVEAVRSDLSRNGSRPFRLDADEIVRAEAYAGRRGAPVRNGSGLISNGRAVTDGLPSRAASGMPALGMPQRAVDLSESQADMLLVTGMATDKILTLAGGRADVILLVARPYRTTLGQLARATASLSDVRPPIVVLAQPTVRLEREGSSRTESEVSVPAQQAPGPEATLVRPGPAMPVNATAWSDRHAAGPSFDGPTLRMARPGSDGPQVVAPLVPVVVSNGMGGSNGSIGHEPTADRSDGQQPVSSRPSPRPQRPHPTGDDGLHAPDGDEPTIPSTDSGLDATTSTVDSTEVDTTTAPTGGSDGDTPAAPDATDAESVGEPSDAVDDTATRSGSATGTPPQ